MLRTDNSGALGIYGLTGPTLRKMRHATLTPGGRNYGSSDHLMCEDLQSPHDRLGVHMRVSMECVLSNVRRKRRDMGWVHRWVGTSLRMSLITRVRSTPSSEHYSHSVISLIYSILVVIVDWAKPGRLLR